MDKSQIPSKSYTFGEGEYVKEVKLYEWITQDEEDKYQSILMGEAEINTDTAEDIKKGKKYSISITVNQVSEARKHLIASYLCEMNIEEFNVLSPTVRAGIGDKVEEIHSKKKIITYRDFVIFFETGQGKNKIKSNKFVNMFNLMERFGWDYYTYIKQPAFFLESCHNYLQAASDYQKSR